MLVREFHSNPVGEGCLLQCGSRLDEVKGQPDAAASLPPFATMTPVPASSETQAQTFLYLILRLKYGLPNPPLE
jgi:hypothetical protein